MFTKTSIFSLVSALVGVSAYAQAEPAAAGEPVPTQAVADIRRARVEIYCGHSSQAVAGIRAASRQLRASRTAVPSEAIAALDQADWLVRHDQYTRAQRALDSALAHITFDVTQA